MREKNVANLETEENIQEINHFWILYCTILAIFVHLKDNFIMVCLIKPF